MSPTSIMSQFWRWSWCLMPSKLPFHKFGLDKRNIHNQSIAISDRYYQVVALYQKIICVLAVLWKEDLGSSPFDLKLIELPAWNVARGSCPNKRIVKWSFMSGRRHIFPVGIRCFKVSDKHHVWNPRKLLKPFYQNTIQVKRLALGAYVYFRLDFALWFLKFSEVSF